MAPGRQEATFLSEDEHLAPRSCEKDLSQTRAVFPIEESWISKSLLLKLPGKELAPNPEKEEP
jgi:hypothetical protein